MSCLRSTFAFSMMPLCTTATVSSVERCGCALRSVGGPCVAQRVCAMPTFPVTGSALSVPSSFAIFPAARRVSIASPSNTAMPAES